MVQQWVRFAPHFFCAVGLCAILVPLTGLVARRLGILAVPTGRHVHRLATPRIGGLAIAASFFVTLGLCVTTLRLEWLGDLNLSANQARLLVLSCAVVLAGGLWDDVRAVRPAVKFGYQFLAAVIAYFGGAALMKADLPLLGEFELGWWAFPVTLVWLVGITNAINLLDGLDGLAAGVSGMIAGGMAFVALYFDNVAVFAVCIAMAGSCFGFLVHNWYPARTFMGDCGSNFLGFFLGCMSLIGNRKGVAAVGLAASFMLLGLPVVDMLFSILRRTLRGRSPFSADRGHLHHLLLLLGLSQRRVVMILYLATLAVGGLGVVAAVARGVPVGYFFVAVLLLAGLTYRWFGFRVRSILLRERGWARAVEKTREQIPGKKDLGAVWKSVSTLTRMMGFGSAELHLLEPNNDEIVGVYKRRFDPAVANQRQPVRLDLGREHPPRAQLILRDFRARRSAHMMHRVALLMPVLDAVDRYIDDLEPSFQGDERAARRARELAATLQAAGERPATAPHQPAQARR